MSSQGNIDHAEYWWHRKTRLIVCPQSIHNHRLRFFKSPPVDLHGCDRGPLATISRTVPTSYLNDVNGDVEQARGL